MTKSKKAIYYVIFLSVIFAMGVAGFAYKRILIDTWQEAQKPELPEAQLYEVFEKDVQEIKNTSVPGANEGDGQNKPIIVSEQNENTQTIPAQINLAVPFTPQAPHANWELPYQEACEEASLLMTARYRNGKEIISPEDADAEIHALVNFQNTLFGDYKDTTAEETARVAREYYGLADTEIRYDFTIDDIKRELARGNPVIVPAAGRQLNNPYFRAPGPLYHMLVIRGYTATHFITNDPGTRRGEEFLYTYDTLMRALHDWNDGDVDNGQKVMIIVK